VRGVRATHARVGQARAQQQAASIEDQCTRTLVARSPHTGGHAPQRCRVAAAAAAQCVGGAGPSKEIALQNSAKQLTYVKMAAGCWQQPAHSARPLPSTRSAVQARARAWMAAAVRRACARAVLRVAQRTHLRRRATLCAALLALLALLALSSAALWLDASVLRSLTRAARPAQPEANGARADAKDEMSAHWRLLFCPPLQTPWTFDYLAPAWRRAGELLNISAPEGPAPPAPPPLPPRPPRPPPPTRRLRVPPAPAPMQPVALPPPLPPARPVGAPAPPPPPMQQPIVSRTPPPSRPLATAPPAPPAAVRRLQSANASLAVSTNASLAAAGAAEGDEQQQALSGAQQRTLRRFYSFFPGAMPWHAAGVFYVRLYKCANNAFKGAFCARIRI
jgi:hypothetical protein